MAEDADAPQGAAAPVRPDPYAKPAQPTLAPTVSAGGTTVDLRLNRAALLSVILGVVGVLLPLAGPVAVVFGVLGLVRAARLRAEGRSASSAVFAGVGLLFGLAATGMLIAAVAGFLATVTVDIRP